MWVCSADVPEKPDNPYSACGIKITRERSDVPLCSFPWPGRQVLLLAFPCLPTCCKCLVTLQGKAANGLRLGGSLVLAADYSRNLPRNLYPRLAAGGTWVRVAAVGVGAWPTPASDPKRCPQHPGVWGPACPPWWHQGRGAQQRGARARKLRGCPHRQEPCLTP